MKSITGKYILQKRQQFANGNKINQSNITDKYCPVLSWSILLPFNFYPLIINFYNGFRKKKS